jgi:CPA1 family monovalent cation:H+ antiporter
MVIGADSRTRVSPGSWETLNSVWEHLDFWATSLIFVTSAMYVPRALGQFSWTDVVNVAVVFAAALASRAAVIWGMMPTFSAMGASKPLNHAYRGVLWWGGMRGAVTVALALATAATEGISEPIRHLVVSTAIGYVIASLVLNGLTLRPLMALLRLDKLSKQDRTLRRRILLLARRRIRKELRDVALAIGHDVEALSAEVLPMDHESLPPTSQGERLLMALDTWCHHENDLVLSFRERGLLTRQHADSLRGHADRLLNALNLGGVEGYLHEAERLRHPPITLRLAFWALHRLGWRAPLAATIANRMEHLVGELLLLRELIGQCGNDAKRLFGSAVAERLKALLSERATAVDTEIKAIEATYAHFARAMHRRHLALVALGLVEAEYRRHLTSATISTDVFEDLDSERRTIAARFSIQPEADLATDLKEARRAIMGRLEDPRVRSCFQSFLTYPGQHLRLPSARSSRAFYLGSGRVEVSNEGQKRRLAAGRMFAVSKAAPGCFAAQAATSLSYCNILEVDIARLKALGFAAPEVMGRLEPRRPPSRAQAAAPAPAAAAARSKRRKSKAADEPAPLGATVEVRRRSSPAAAPKASEAQPETRRGRTRSADKPAAVVAQTLTAAE